MLMVCPYALCAARLTERREAYLREAGKNERGDSEVGHELRLQRAEMAEEARDYTEAG